MDVSQYLVYGVPIVALVIGLVKVSREAGLPSKFAPGVSLFLGVLFGLLMALEGEQPLLGGALVGVVVGLSACGIYDVGKKTIDG